MAPQSYAAWRLQFEDAATAAGLFDFYLSEDYLPDDVETEAYAKHTMAIKTDRMRNPPFYSLQGLTGAELTARVLAIEQHESQIGIAAIDKHTATAKKTLRAQAKNFLSSSLSANFRSLLDHHPTPFSLWTSIMERHDTDTSVNDPTSLIAAISDLHYTPQLGPEPLFSTLHQHIKRCKTAMTPHNLSEMSGQQYCDYVWEHFHTIYLCNAFVLEAPIWRAVCHIQLKAKKANTICTPDQLEKEIRTLLEVESTRLLRVGDQDSADSSARRNHVAAAPVGNQMFKLRILKVPGPLSKMRFLRYF
jgi:hypothetical protein